MRWRTITVYSILILPTILILLLFLNWTANLSFNRFSLGASFLISLLLIFISAWYADRNSNSVDELLRSLEATARDPAAPAPLPEGQGEVGRIVYALRQIEDKRSRQAAKRRRDNDRLLTLLTYMADGVIILNGSGRVRLLNPAAERLLDADADLAIDRTFIQVARDHRIAMLWQQCQETQSEGSLALELMGERFVQVVVTPFIRGGARGYLVLIQDLTEIRHLQTVRQDFVANVSHELRTPLASLRALAETLNDGALDDPPAARRFLTRIEVEVDAMTQVVQELLDLSRIEAGKTPLVLNLISPHDLILPSVERLQAQADKAQITLRVDVPSTLSEFKVDRTRLQQVIINLVHNAIKFTPPGGRITVSAIEENDSIIVTVEDDGVGIAFEDLGRVFERFYKSDRARAGGGTGLGLAIAKHVIQAHDGHIWAESNEGTGSRFAFSIPLRTDPLRTEAESE